MQYDATTPQEYLELLDRDWRRVKLLELRQLIMWQGPELTEGIDYGMRSYSDARGGIFGLNGQKHIAGGRQDRVLPDMAWFISATVQGPEGNPRLCKSDYPLDERAAQRQDGLGTSIAIRCHRARPCLDNPCGPQRAES